MESTVIKRGIIQAFNQTNWTATVQVLPSQGNYLTGVQVAKHLLAAEIAVGDECAILFFNELNPADAVVIAVYSVPSAAPVLPVTSLSGGVGGAALVGAVQLVPGTSGRVSISESGQQIIIDASGGGGSTVVQNAGTFTITDSALHTIASVSVTLAATSDIWLSVLATVNSSGTNGLKFHVKKDGTAISELDNLMLKFPSSASDQYVLHVRERLLGVASGSHTFTVGAEQAFAINTINGFVQASVEY